MYECFTACTSVHDIHAWCRDPKRALALLKLELAGVGEQPARVLSPSPEVYVLSILVTVWGGPTPEC